MVGLRESIKQATDVKKMPAFAPGNIGDLATKLGMSFPVSISDIVADLGKLPPSSVTFDSGPLSANDVHGSAYLFLQSDGGIAWGGSAEEKAVIGDNFRFSVALLDVRDETGRVLVFVHEDTVVGTLEPGFSTKTWNDSGINSVVAKNWESAKSSRIDFRLHASTDPLQAIEGVFEAIVVVVGAIIGGKAASDQMCPPPQQWKCGWGPVTSSGSSNDPRNSPGLSVDYVCHCE